MREAHRAAVRRRLEDRVQHLHDLAPLLPGAQVVPILVERGHPLVCVRVVGLVLRPEIHRVDP